MIGIYKITNKIDGKCYIGQSRDIVMRFNRHRNYTSNQQDYPLYRAFRKYGIENFSFDVIEECSLDELNEKEIFYIEKYDSYYNGYNQTLGGQGAIKPVKISDEDIQTIYELLMYSNLTQKEIAEKFSVGMDTISEINNGKTRINPKLIYPLRMNYHKRNYVCVDCGKPISYGSVRCQACNAKHQAIPLEKMKITREELKNLIRTTPFTTIASQYGVTDNAIRKWCDKFNLPRKKKDIKNISDKDWEKI